MLRVVIEHSAVVFLDVVWISSVEISRLSWECGVPRWGCNEVRGEVDIEASMIRLGTFGVG
jgi:hypothetical protein